MYAVDKNQKTWACHPFHRIKQGGRIQYGAWGWGLGDRVIKAGELIFNAEIYTADVRIRVEVGKLCGCVGCIFRRDQSLKTASVRRLILAVAGLHKQELMTRHTGRYNTVGWDDRCPICSRAMKAADRHSLALPDLDRLEDTED